MVFHYLVLNSPVVLGGLTVSGSLSFDAGGRQTAYHGLMKTESSSGNGALTIYEAGTT